MNAPDDQKSSPPEASPIQPLAATIGQLPGEFAIRTYLKDTFLTARDGGRHSINAVTTDASGAGARLFEKFKLTALQPDFTTIQTVFAFFVSALGGGGSTNAAQVLQTERTAVADDALFRFVGPYRNGVYTIGTFNNHFLTALGGGGKTTDAFHTDATSASTWEQFRLIKSGDLGSGHTYAIIQTGVKATSSPSNQYLNAVDGGGRATQAMTAFGDLGLNARFKLIGLADGSFAIQAPDGIHYVTADDGGGIEGETLSLRIRHTSKPGRHSKFWTTMTVYIPFRLPVAFFSALVKEESSPHESATLMRPPRLVITPGSSLLLLD